MRRSSFAALSALCFALVSGLWLAAAAAESPDAQVAETETAPPKSEVASPEAESSTEGDADLESLLNSQELLGLEALAEPLPLESDRQPESARSNADFPLYSSRRTWGWNRFAGQSSSEPALFVAEDPQPLFRVSGENEIVEAPVFRNAPSTFRSAGGTQRDVPQQVDSYGNIIHGNITLSGNGVEFGPVGQPNFTIDTWGIHPATPVPTPVPASDVLIDNRVIPAAVQEDTSGSASDVVLEESFDIAKFNPQKHRYSKQSADSKAEAELQQGEAAKVILELMDTLGRSVLDGTVFEKPTEVDAQWLKDLDANDATPREALIQYIRALEAQEEHARQQAPVTQTAVMQATGEPAAEEEIISISAEEIEIGVPCEVTGDDDREVEVELHQVDDEQANVESLRETSEELERLANQLERRDNYFRADQLRELAAQLRFDARRVHSPEMAEMMPPGGSMPINAPFSLGNMLPPPQLPYLPPSTSYPAPFPAYGPMMPGGAPPAMAPTPQPTFESSPTVKQLEAELQVLRNELHKSRQQRGVRGATIR